MISYDIKQAPPNMVIIEVGKALEDTVEFGKMQLHIDPLFNPTFNTRIFGTVIALPASIAKNDHGVDIEPELKVGDKVYFHYLGVNNESNNIYGNYYKMPYYFIFCAIRDDNIIPVAGWTLCSPVVEQTFDQVEVNGKKIDAIISSSGLVTQLKKEASVEIARLKYIGKPLRGEQELGVSKGDLIVLNKNSNFMNKIEKTDYYTVRQRDILGKKFV
jgi:co-chaperonin GroES (HSP10)